MSWEGYYVYLCEQGHKFGGNGFEDEPTLCPFCKSPAVYSIQVDTTNGAGDDGLCPGEARVNALRLRIPAAVQTCNLGHQHVVAPAIYEVPK